MIISIGDIAIDLKDVSLSTLPKELVPYILSGKKSEGEIYGKKSDGVCFFSDFDIIASSDKTLFDSKTTWRVEDYGNTPAICIYAGDNNKKLFQRLLLKDDLSEGEAWINKSLLEDGSLSFALRQPLLELWYAFLLMSGRGILVHGLAVLKDGLVNIFAGKSGAGKSTLGGVFHNENIGHILSDDRVIIRKKEDGYYAYGTPWHGEARFASNQYGKLDNIYFLNQAKLCSITDMSGGKAAASLFATTFIAGWPRDTGMQFVLNFCSDLTEQISIHRLNFTPDKQALKTLKYL
ncbi:MAG: hypothetical protein JXR91_15840 [Deltaproteobacteria bacterium]|nr:hypothetical protein [Deltaproteobacteria bacterium]